MAFEAEHRLLTPGRRVLAAVSGGPDSVCLAHWLSVQARKKGLTVTLVHVHHGLRGRAADGDARFVEKLGAKLGLAVAIIRAPVRALAAKRGLGLEEAGRKERYRVLGERVGAGASRRSRPATSSTTRPKPCSCTCCAARASKGSAAFP